MNEYIGELSLDLDCRKTLPRIAVGQFDKGRKYLIHLTANGSPYSASESTVVIQGIRNDKSHFSAACEVDNSGDVILTINEGILSVKGMIYAKLVLSDASKNYSTQIFAIDVDNSFEGDISETDDYSVFNDFLNRLFIVLGIHDTGEIDRILSVQNVQLSGSDRYPNINNAIESNMLYRVFNSAGGPEGWLIFCGSRWFVNETVSQYYATRTGEIKYRTGTANNGTVTWDTEWKEINSERLSDLEMKKVNAPMAKQVLTPTSTVNGKLYHFGNGSEYSLAAAAYSDFAVQEGKLYLVSGTAVNGNKYCLGGFFDEQDQLLQTFGTESGSSGKNYTDYPVAAPANAVRVRVNSARANSSSKPNPIVCALAEYDTDCISTINSEIGGIRTDLSDNAQNLMNTQNMLGVLPYETKPGFYRLNGNYSSNSSYECGVIFLDVAQGDKFLYKGSGGADAASVVFYDSSEAVVSSEAWSKDNYHEVVIPAGVARVLFTSTRKISSTPVLTFEVYKVGGIYSLYQMASNATPSTQPAKTLNLTNRLYAAETMGVSRQVNLPQGKAVFCVGFDDYNLDCLEAVEYLAHPDTEKGEIDISLPCYLALIPDRVTDDWAMARLCYENGGEIAAHSGTVLTNRNQTFELMNDKFIDIPAKIGEAGFPVYGIIRAGGTDQGSEDTWLDEFYCRAAGLKYSDCYGRSAQYTLGRTSLLTKSVSDWHSYLDSLAANGGYCIAFCHHFEGKEKKYAYEENGFWIEDFKAIMEHAKSLINNPSYDFEVLTINEFVDRYIYGINSTDAFVRS